MLAADKLLLRSTVKQRTIELREKELNLFNSNFSAVATQAALLAGFSMAFLEMSVHLHGLHFNPIAKGLLHLFSTICVCSNIFVVSIITFVSVWGSGKALRGKDGSMSKVVEGMNKERWLIFYTFGVRHDTCPAPSLSARQPTPTTARRAMLLSGGTPRPAISRGGLDVAADAKGGASMGHQLLGVLFTEPSSS